MIPWPKATIDSMVNSVAKALWSNRSGWRNPELFFSQCTNSIACHPHMSIATIESFATLLLDASEMTSFLACGLNCVVGIRLLLVVWLMLSLKLVKPLLLNLCSHIFSAAWDVKFLSLSCQLLEKSVPFCGCVYMHKLFQRMCNVCTSYFFCKDLVWIHGVPCRSMIRVWYFDWCLPYCKQTL